MFSAVGKGVEIRELPYARLFPTAEIMRTESLRRVISNTPCTNKKREALKLLFFVIKIVTNYWLINLVHPFHQLAFTPAASQAPRKLTTVNPDNLASAKLAPVRIGW